MASKGLIAIERIGVNNTKHAIDWSVIYLVGSVIHFKSNEGQARVVRKVDKAIHWVNYDAVRLNDFLSGYP